MYSELFLNIIHVLMSKVLIKTLYC